MSQVLVTGAAGFIGYHLCQRLLAMGQQVVGIDNLNSYYEVSLKQARLEQLLSQPGFRFFRLDISDRCAVEQLFHNNTFEQVINLAAQAGVRYSLENPHAYVDSNLVGFMNILEGCRQRAVKHLVFASSSSVYGANSVVPFSEHQNVDHPISLYAATKKANELMAHSYAALYGLPCSGLRFFTVYGPWGRPDMAYFSFTRAILAGETISLYNKGMMQRDFTYIDDIIEGIVRVLDTPPVPDAAWDRQAPDPASSFAPWQIYNIGNNQPVELLKFVDLLEQCLGRVANKKFLPMQAGDLAVTSANINNLLADHNCRPTTSIEEGLARFTTWYRQYYHC